MPVERQARAEVLHRPVHVAGQEVAEPGLGHRVAVDVGPSPERRMERRRPLEEQADVVNEQALHLFPGGHAQADLGRSPDQRALGLRRAEVPGVLAEHIRPGRRGAADGDVAVRVRLVERLQMDGFGGRGRHAELQRDPAARAPAQAIGEELIGDAEPVRLQDAGGLRDHADQAAAVLTDGVRGVPEVATKADEGLPVDQDVAGRDGRGHDRLAGEGLARHDVPSGQALLEVAILDERRQSGDAGVLPDVSDRLIRRLGLRTGAWRGASRASRDKSIRGRVADEGRFVSSRGMGESALAGGEPIAGARGSGPPRGF